MQLIHLNGEAPLYTNSFLLLADNGKAVIIDPAASAQTYNELLRQHGARLTKILCTHGHYDHVGAAQALREAWNAALYLAAADRCGGRLYPQTDADFDLAGGEVITEGDIRLRVLATPGHSQGSVCFLGDGVLFCGDTLFAGSAGRTDMQGGSEAQLASSLHKLADTVPNETRVFPGHEEFSTMAREKNYNPYLAAWGYTPC